MKTIIILIFSTALIAVISAIIKKGQPFRPVIQTVFQGLTSLTAVNVFGLITGVTLSINWYTLAFVSVFGMPGTITLTVLKFIFR